MKCRESIRWVFRVLRVLLIAYVGICALLFFQQRALIYPAQLTNVLAGDTNFSLDRGDAVLRGWLLNPGRERAVIYFGGNAENIEYAARMLADALPDASVHAVAYRGYGASDGTPSEQALFADALAIYDEVRALQPHAAIAVVGRSLGSGVASYVAAHRPLDRLALVTPFDSLASLAQSMYPLLPLRWLLHDRYDSVRHLAGYRGPLLIVRGGRDRIIAPASTDRLIASLAGDAQVLVLETSGHNDIDADTRYLAALVAFLDPE